jgi:hypothetical protein
MLIEVRVNGFTYFADPTRQVLYTDRDRKSGTPFNYLTKEEQRQVDNEIRFPRQKTEEE